MEIFLQDVYPRTTLHRIRHWVLTQPITKRFKYITSSSGDLDVSFSSGRKFLDFVLDVGSSHEHLSSRRLVEDLV